MASQYLDSAVPLIGTHSGTFHADEALAVSMLRLLPTYAHASLLRSRDPSRLSTCSIIVDVGGEYNPSTHRYDHHQRSFNTSFPSRPTKLSSAGLIWLHFGRDIISTATRLPEYDPSINLLWEKLYLEFIEAIDAHDNGISVYDMQRLSEAEIEKRFSDSGNSISAVVADMNSSWNAEVSGGDAQTEEDSRFIQASQFMGDVFQRKLKYYAHSWLPARSLVQNAFMERKNFDPQGRLLVLDRPMPWKSHLYSLELESQVAQQEEMLDEAPEEVLYVLYPESAPPTMQERGGGGGGSQNTATPWRIQAVPTREDSFESRKPLPQAWRGVRDEDLERVSGIPGTIFVHASGFIGGNRTWEGALKMAQVAITES
ncbi:MAG: hypothetical protein M1823_000594 [Watsoniomyces obsoletus]|nr:MAG: hypothetical protein M1823_000594 [Watsoniomyces obsoletus]